MTSFEDLLSRLHHYRPSDFGAGGGEVAIDSARGTVNPLSGDGKSVALSDLFKTGQYVSLDLHGEEAERMRFVVVGVNQDGLDAVSSTGERGFLPWEVMAAALRWSRQVYIDVLNEMENLDEQDQAFVRQEIGRLTTEIRYHRSIASELSEQLDKLQSIGRGPSLERPSTWLVED